jgi:site-specific recombinase XerD
MNGDEQTGLLMDLGSDPTLRAGIKYFEIVGMPVRGYTARTRDEYGRDLRDLAHFLESRGIVKLDQITLPHLEIYQAVMKQRRYSPSTRQRKTCAVRSLFSFLHRHSVTRHDVAKKLFPPRRPVTLPRYLSKREHQALIDACAASLRDTALMQLMLQTGMAVFEVTRANLDDLLELPKQDEPGVDDTGLILVRGRRGRERTIPLNSKAAEALHAYLRERPDPTDDSRALFVSRGLRRLSARSIREMITKYLKAAGIPRASARTLRHTHAVHFALHGASRLDVQENLGLSDEEGVEKYWELARLHKRRIMQEHAL